MDSNFSNLSREKFTLREDGIAVSSGDFSLYFYEILLLLITPRMFVVMTARKTGVGDLNSETQMYSKYPFLETMVRKMMEETMADVQDEYADLLDFSPEDRYLALLKLLSSFTMMIGMEISMNIAISPAIF